MQRDHLLVSVVGAIVLLLAPPASAQKSANNVRVGFNDPLSTVDPDYDPKPESNFGGKAVFDSLIYYSADAAEFKPFLAESWKRIDDTTIEFKLRKDVKWHDGEAITEHLRAIGIRTSLRRHTFGTYRKAQADNELQAFVGRYSSGGLPDTSAILEFYVGRTPRDYAHNDILDKLHEEGADELDVEKRKKIYGQAMDRFNQMNYVFPIATNPAVFVHSGDIRIKTGSLNNFGIEASDVSWK